MNPDGHRAIYESVTSLPIVLTGAILVALLMFVLWLIQRKHGDAGIVDAGWAGSLAFFGLWYALFLDGHPIRRWLLAVMALTWGGRLAWHLVTDRLVGKPEDGRYRRMRSERGATVQTFFFWFYQAQGIAALILSLPFFLAAGAAPSAPGITDNLAVGLWLIGMVGVSVADRQLARFRSDPGNRGRTCREGLWRTSRHPNYFFEWILWCGFALLAWPAVWGWLGMASPMILLFLILFVTGIPPTEAQALASRGDDYRDYQRTTSPFIPWFTRRRSS